VDAAGVAQTIQCCVDAAEPPVCIPNSLCPCGLSFFWVRVGSVLGQWCVRAACVRTRLVANTLRLVANTLSVGAVRVVPSPNRKLISRRC
jgi:hypothetical protein